MASKKDSPTDSAKNSCMKNHIMIERLIPFSVDEKPFPPFLCTPDSLEALAVGHMLAQGWLDSAQDILSVAQDGPSISLHTLTGIKKALPLDERLAILPPLPTGVPLSLPEAVEMVRSLVEVDEFFGTHALMLRSPWETWVRQDVGRHNALDKVIGLAAMAGTDFSQCIVAATGRISLEMLAKAAVVGIPIIVSKKYPSDLSQEHAARLNIRIIGNALSKSPIVYT